jgi:hypothetical protein
MMPATILLLLALASAESMPPDLQVTTSSADGTELTELGQALAQALVAGGSRVVLVGPATAPCSHCVRISVTEHTATLYRIDVRGDGYQETQTLNLPAGSPAFDRARALALHARSLLRFPDERPHPPTKSDPPTVAHSSERRPTSKSLVSPPQGKAAPKPQPTPEDAAGEPVAPVASQDRPQPVQPRESKLSRVAEERHSPLDEPDGPRTLRPRWPWIPILIGAGTAAAAGLCALVARQKYNEIGDRTRTYPEVLDLQREGQRWQTASFVLAGVATAGLVVGLTGFLLGGQASPGPGVTASHSGAMLLYGGALP